MFLPHDEDAPAMKDECFVPEMFQEWERCWDTELQDPRRPGRQPADLRNEPEVNSG